LAIVAGELPLGTTMISSIALIMLIVHAAMTVFDLA